jgi:glycosyltransferase involved in cell wall biosynthesis
MRIGIDVSQLAYSNTGVANYLENLVFELIKNKKNEYILFFSSLRRNVPPVVSEFAKKQNVTVKTFRFPPFALNMIWNNIHKIPIEHFIGDIDWFITSDWTEPPVKCAKKATILYDLIVYRYPNETDEKIISVQKKKLSWVKKESDLIFCISESTKKDAKDILKIDNDRLKIIYPGFNSLS